MSLISTYKIQEIKGKVLKKGHDTNHSFWCQAFKRMYLHANLKEDVWKDDSLEAEEGTSLGTREHMQQIPTNIRKKGSDLVKTENICNKYQQI